MNKVLIPLLKTGGNEVTNPWDFDTQMETALSSAASVDNYQIRKNTFTKINKKIGSRNEASIQEADILVAVLEGQEVDSGVAAEVGYAYGIGKKVIGYRSDLRQAGENVGCRMNLQVEFFVESSGGMVVSSLEDLRKVLADTSDNVANKS